MHDDLLPLAINPTEILLPENGYDANSVANYQLWHNALTSALTVAHSGIMSVDSAAVVLQCSVDTVRRIPMEELASYEGPGRGVLYRMEDIQHYLHRRKRHQKRRSGLGQPVNSRPDPKAGARNLAADALMELNIGVGA